jgi:hypothetical protein
MRRMMPLLSLPLPLVIVELKIFKVDLGMRSYGEEEEEEVKKILLMMGQQEEEVMRCQVMWKSFVKGVYQRKVFLLEPSPLQLIPLLLLLRDSPNLKDKGRGQGCSL